MKNIQSIKSLFLLLTFTILSCSRGGSGGDEEPQLPGLKNLTVDVEVVGKNSENPNGDGSGIVNFIAKADNATNYKILIDGETKESSNGKFSHTFKIGGVNTYQVIVVAYNGTQNISQNINVTVLVNSQLVWSDEFNYEGAPDSAFWIHEIGNGDGWGNNELEYYTNRLDNAIVSNGTLKINLKKESFEGFNYTSARLITKGKYSFKYGKIEFRAKLPTGAGTWPALWMLGSNIDTVPWPACGEIDVMEHVGNQQNIIHGSLHSPQHYGGNADTGTVNIPTASTEFHIYSVEWNASSIKFFVDGQLYHSYANNAATPFNSNFFIIMNVAMGGNFGGNVDPNFVASTMEVDYVRVYQ